MSWIANQNQTKNSLVEFFNGGWGTITIILIILVIMVGWCKRCGDDKPPVADTQVTMLFLNTLRVPEGMTREEVLNHPILRHYAAQEVENIVRSVSRNMTVNKPVLDTLDMQKISDPNYRPQNVFK